MGKRSGRKGKSTTPTPTDAWHYGAIEASQVIGRCASPPNWPKESPGRALQLPVWQPGDGSEDYRSDISYDITQCENETDEPWDSQSQLDSPAIHCDRCSVIGNKLNVISAGINSVYDQLDELNQYFAQKAFIANMPATTSTYGIERPQLTPHVPEKKPICGCKCACNGAHKTGGSQTAWKMRKTRK